MNNLNEQHISDTFEGLLHASGAELPSSGKQAIYDGNGNKTAISIGREGNGMEVDSGLTTKSLTVSGINYPTQQSSTGKGIVVQTAVNTLTIVPKLSGDNLATLDPDPSGSYTGYINRIDVSSQGLVTFVSASSFSSGGGSGNDGNDGTNGVGVQAFCQTVDGDTTPSFAINSGFTSVTRLKRGVYEFIMTSSSSAYIVQATAITDLTYSTPFNVSCTVNKLTNKKFVVYCGFEDGDRSQWDADIMVSVIY